jgi:hypothetical protein
MNPPPLEFAETLLSYIPSRPIYDEWIRIISAIANTYDKYTAKQLLLNKFRDEKFNEHEKKIKARLKNIGFGTLVYIAKRYGFDWSKTNYANYKSNFDINSKHKEIHKKTKLLNLKNYSANDLMYDNNNERLYRIAVNRTVIDKNINPKTNKPYSNFYALNNNFKNEIVRLSELKEIIKAGYSLIFAKLKEPIVRNKSHFELAELFAIDFDGKVTINEIINHKITQNGGLLLYTTVNHTNEIHRFRLIFSLGFVVKDINDYEYIIQTFINQYNKYRVIADKNCSDGTRAFYGNRNAMFYVLKENKNE